jgi:hypothetical protein
MNLNIDRINHPGEWALQISHKLGATEYINPPGGKDLFDRDQYQKHGITLQYLEINSYHYDQKRNHFEAGLSIIDVMMFNDQSRITNYLDNYNLSQ